MLSVPDRKDLVTLGDAEADDGACLDEEPSSSVTALGFDVDGWGDSESLGFDFLLVEVIP